MQTSALRADVLQLLEQALGAEGQFSPEVFAWLQAGLRAYIDGLNRLALDECLGMKVERGEPSIARRYRASRRSAAIVDAWKAIDGAESLGAWRRGEILATEIADFEARLWPLWKGSGAAPQGASRLRLALFDAFAADPDNPPAKTTKGLLELLRRVGELT